MQVGLRRPGDRHREADLGRRFGLRPEATGVGVVMVVSAACARLGWQLAEQRCVVQGFGKVGGIAARELATRRDASSPSRTCPAASTPRRARPPRVEDARRARRAGRLPARAPHHERGAARARVRRARPRGSREQVTGENAAASRRHDRRGRERAHDARGRRDPRRARASRCCPTSSRTRAASRSRTSSGSRTSGACSGRRRDPRGSPRSSSDAFDACGTSPRSARPLLPHRRSRVAGSVRSPRRSRRGGYFRDLVRERWSPIRGACRRTRPRGPRASCCARPRCAPSSSPTSERLVGVVTRKRSFARWSPKGAIRMRQSSARSPKGPITRSGPMSRSRMRFHFLEEHDPERVPVVDGERRLVGVLSRSVLGRRWRRTRSRSKRTSSRRTFRRQRRRRFPPRVLGASRADAAGDEDARREGEAGVRPPARGALYRARCEALTAGVGAGRRRALLGLRAARRPRRRRRAGCRARSPRSPRGRTRRGSRAGRRARRRSPARGRARSPARARARRAVIAASRSSCALDRGRERCGGRGCARGSYSSSPRSRVGERRDRAGDADGALGARSGGSSEPNVRAGGCELGLATAGPMPRNRSVSAHAADVEARPRPPSSTVRR